MAKRTRKRKSKRKKENPGLIDTYRLSPEGLAADYFNHFIGLVYTVETMNMYEEPGREDDVAEWREKLLGSVKDFKTFETHVSERRGSFNPDKNARELDRVSKEVPLCAIENIIDYKKLGKLIAEGIRLCIDEDRAPSVLQRAEAAIEHCISRSISAIDKALRQSPFSTRMQLTAEVPLDRALSMNYRNEFNTVVSMLITIRTARESGRKDMEDDLQQRIRQKLGCFRSYSQHVRSLLEEYKGFGTIDANLAMQVLCDDNPYAKRLEALSADIRTTLSDSGSIDYGNLQKLIIGMMHVYAETGYAQNNFDLVNRAFKPYTD